MVSAHEVFIEPIDLNQKIWRYMDFTKFIDLLNSQELYFTRPDKFEDVFEGRLSQATIRDIEANFDGTPEQNAHQTMLLTRGAFKQASTLLFGVNCWHMNDHESAAMWKLYLKSNEGIAIQTTYSKLKQALVPSDTECFMGIVHYIDYDNDIMGSNNLFIPLVHKRKSFEHEKEVRAVVIIKANVPVAGTPVKTLEQLMPGVRISLSLEELIEAVYVSPDSPQWLTGLVEDTCRKFGYKFSIVNSRLSEQPIY